MRFLFISLLVFSTSIHPFCSFAQTTVEDPKNLLKQIDAFISPELIPFEKQLHCGDSAVFDHQVTSCEFSCSDFGCATVCTSEDGRVANHFVSDCIDNRASIFSDDAENMEFTHEEYETLHGNLARKFMANLSTYIAASGTLVLTEIKPTTYTLEPGVSGSPSFSALNIMGYFVIEGFEDGPEVIFTVLKGVPGVAQLARFRIGSNTWFRLKSFEKGVRL